MKNHIIFSLVLFFLMLGIYFAKAVVEKIILEPPKVNKPIGGQEYLLSGDYEQLTMKELIGSKGFFEILDKEGKLLYTSPEKKSLDEPIRNGRKYTEGEIRCIPRYNANLHFSAVEYETEEGKKQTLLTGRIYEGDTGYKEEVIYVILDEDLQVIQSSRSYEWKQLTEKEILYLTQKSDTGYSVYKDVFTEKGGAERILIMHVKKLDGPKYRRLASLWKFFVPMYALAYAVTTLFFTFWLQHKVREPLNMLNEGILALSEGDRNTQINYRGPREFELIFDNFNQMAEKLKVSEAARERLIVEKQKMLADISHDLKTPITVIQGYAKAVSDGLADEETRERYLDTIFCKTESLTEMINTFHDYSKLEHPEFVLVKEKQDIAEFIREYLADKYNEIDLMGFALEVGIPEERVEYSFDAVQFKRVFDNLFSNALRHNQAGTTIYLTLQQMEKSIRIEMGDNGMGIPKELLENLFEPFTVGDDSRNNRQGSGLGLAVARKIVELHGGALFLEKAENPAISTLFVIRLMK